MLPFWGPKLSLSALDGDVLPRRGGLSAGELYRGAMEAVGGGWIAGRQDLVAWKQRTGSSERGVE